MTKEIIKAEYVYDLDPRYGWVHVGAHEHESVDFVIQTKDGAFGYTFVAGEFVPRCVCHAYNEDECCCDTGDWA